MIKYYAVFKFSCNVPDDKSVFKSTKLFKSARMMDMSLTSKTFDQLDDLVELLESKAKNVLRDVVKKIPDCNLQIQKLFNEYYFPDVKNSEKLECESEERPLAFRITVQEFLDEKMFKLGYTLFEADLFVLEQDDMYEILH